MADQGKGKPSLREKQAKFTSRAYFFLLHSPVSRVYPMAMRTPETDRVIETAGGPAKVAALLGLTSQAVSQWDKVPPTRVLVLSRALGIPAHEIRPDIFPTPEEAA